MRRVVITGLGAVSPLGNSFEETWNAAKAGKSGVGRISRFDPTESPVQIAAEVKNFDPSSKVGRFQPFAPKDARRAGRFIHLGVHAGTAAYLDSGLDDYRAHFADDRMGINIGAGMGGLPEICDVYETLRTKGYNRVTPFFIPQVIPNLVAGQLAILINARGPNMCSVSACASSSHAIGESFRAIQFGTADIMIAGGAEAVISPLGIAGFAALTALSSRNTEPEKASRPFDVARDGFIMGEGAASMVLEEYEFAKKRGAKIYGEIVGYGASCDAYHITSPSPEGEGGERAMLMAIKEAKISGDQVGYVNAHATSTPVGDIEEPKAIYRVAPKAIVSSTKSMTGHLLGAAGALEGMFTALAIRDGVIPPTINLDELDSKLKELPMNFAPHKAIETRFEYGLSNSFGFGGTNASLLFKRF